MIRSFGLLSIAIFLAFTGFCQSNSVLDTGKMILKYEDGSVFRGRLFRGDGLNRPMLISTGDTIHISVFKVDEYLLDDEVYFFRKEKYQLKNGYFACGSWSFGGSYNFTSQFDMTLGWTYSSKLSLGAGFGIGYSDMSINGYWVYHEFWTPHVYGRYYFNNNRIRFFIEGKAGMALRMPSWSDEYKGGVYLHPAFGFSLASKNRFKWHFSVSKYLVHAKGSFEEWENSQSVTYNYNILHNRTLFQIGLSYVITKSQLRKDFF